MRIYSILLVVLLSGCKCKAPNVPDTTKQNVNPQPQAGGSTSVILPNGNGVVVGGGGGSGSQEYINVTHEQVPCTPGEKGFVGPGPLFGWKWHCSPDGEIVLDGPRTPSEGARK